MLSYFEILIKTTYGTNTFFKGQATAYVKLIILKSITLVRLLVTKPKFSIELVSQKDKLYNTYVKKLQKKKTM